MSLSAAVIRELVAAGLSGEALIAACERIEASSPVHASTGHTIDAQAERRRASDRERKRLRNSAEFCGIAESPLPLSSPLFPSHTPPSHNPPIIPHTAHSTGGAKPFDGKAELIGMGCDEKHIADWVAVRKAKKAGPITSTVIASLKREAERAGVSVPVAVRTAAERGWQGFNADWLRRDAPAATARHGPSRTPPRNTLVEALHQMTGRHEHPDSPYS